MEYSIATYALLMVRYRSAEAAIDFVLQPQFGMYRHAFVPLRLHQGDDMELGESKIVCFLCHEPQSLHQAAEMLVEPDKSDLANQLAKMELEEPLLLRQSSN